MNCGEIFAFEIVLGWQQPKLFPVQLGLAASLRSRYLKLKVVDWKQKL